MLHAPCRYIKYLEIGVEEVMELVLAADMMNVAPLVEIAMVSHRDLTRPLARDLLHLWSLLQPCCSRHAVLVHLRNCDSCGACA